MPGKIIKITLMAVIVLALALIWLLPKTAWGRRLRMNETIYLFINWLGVIFGLAGLICTFIWPKPLASWHLWEALVLPWALGQMYCLLVLRSHSGGEIFDEKQACDMGQAAGGTLAVAVVGMSFLYILPDDLVQKSLIFYPFFLFMVMGIFSAGSIYFFRKS